MLDLGNLKINAHRFCSPQRRATVVALQTADRPINSKAVQYQVALEHLALISQLEGKADAVFLPENSTYGYISHLGSTRFSQVQAAEELGGPLHQLFSAAAKKFNLLIGFGLLRLQGASLFHSYIVTDGSAEPVVCDKSEIFTGRIGNLGSYVQTTAGQGYAHFTLKGLNFSLLICRDLFEDRIRTGAEKNEPTLIIMPCHTQTAGHYDPIVKRLSTSLLTVNYAQADCGRSTIYERVDEQRIRKTSLGYGPGLLFATL